MSKTPLNIELMRSLIEQTLIAQEHIEKKQRENEEARTDQEENKNQDENTKQEKTEYNESDSAPPLRLKQTARKRPSTTHSDQIPKVQTARKHTVSGFLFEKHAKRQIKNIRKRSFQIDIYEIEVDRADDDHQEDPETKSKLFFSKYLSFSNSQN
jgi:hypothetical protein